MVGVGCAEIRTYQIVTAPPDAAVRINGNPVDRRQPRTQLAFSSPEQTYSLVATRAGFEDASLPVTAQTPEGPLSIALRPRTKPIAINVEPAAATIFVDGRPVTGDAAASVNYDLVYAIDANLRSVPHTIRAERSGFAPAERTIDFNDQSSQYTLTLAPLLKTISIVTQPEGAALTLDGVAIGNSPARLADQPFAYDATKEKFVPRAIVATKPGYPPTRVEIAWDDGKTDYVVPLDLFKKQVAIRTEPADAKVTIDGKPVATAKPTELTFPPIDESGTLKTYAVDATVEHPGEIWKPLKATLAYDDGKAVPTLKLEEILIRTVPSRSIQFQTKDGRWSPTIIEAPTTAFKDVTDADLGKPTRVTDLPAGAQIDSFAISPDGQSVAYALLDADKKRARSRLYIQRIEAGSAATSLTDGRQLDVTPTFSPAGDAVVFSSDRGGGPMQIWSIPLDGNSGTTRLTSGNADQLWPGLDSSPRPRVFYEGLVPGQDSPRLFSAQVGTSFETDLVGVGGSQPRLSPRDDAIVFVHGNDQSKTTDLFRAGDKGGVVKNLTSTPDVSERDPAWSPDAARVAMTIDAPATQPARPAQTEIAIVNADGGGKPTPVTRNDAIDDLPAWSPTGDAIFFRSNRGGKWDLWRIDVK